MCILLKLHYAKFDVSRLFCSKVIEEKPCGGGGVGSIPSNSTKETISNQNSKIFSF